MKNKCVLITGTTNGIGKDLKNIYLSKKYEVISVNRVGSEVQNIKNSYNFNIDISNKDEVNNLFITLNNKNFVPEIYIFNAGINKTDFIGNYNNKNFNEVINTNFLSVTYFCNNIINNNIQNKTLIFISSFSTIYYNKNCIGYYFSKLMINRYFEEIKISFPNNNYKLIAFGPIETKIKRFFRNENTFNKFLFSVLSIKSFRAAKVIYNFSISKSTLKNYPYKVYLFYKFCRFIAVK